MLDPAIGQVDGYFKEIWPQHHTFQDKDHLYTSKDYAFQQINFHSKETLHIHLLLTEVIPCKTTITGIIPRDFIKPSSISQSQPLHKDSMTIEF
jgi:hypothetical protein